MSVPILCLTCGQVIGVLDGDALLASDFEKYNGPRPPCPGQNKHPLAVKESRTRWFGFIKESRYVYSATHTKSEWRSN